MKRFALALVVPIALASGVAACGSSSSSDAVTIGVTDGAQAFWQVYKGLAKDQGIDVELKNFSDYKQPNAALNDGDLNINEYQHLLFLADYNAKNNTKLVPIGATAIYPLPLYSKKHTSVGQFPQGGKIAIPNDPTNQARALLLLQSAGLLKLKGGGTSLSTPADIDAFEPGYISEDDDGETKVNFTHRGIRPHDRGYDEIAKTWKERIAKGLQPLISREEEHA